MGPAETAIVALLLVAYTLVSRRASSWPVSMPMVFVAAGAAMEFSGAVDVSADTEAIALLAEVTLAVILFSDAVRIDLARLRKVLAIPIRLLAIGLPLSIVLGAMVNSLIFPDLSIVQVALLAAILAPTDAALGSAVVEDPAVPIRDRLALNVESGVNDGLVVPVVAILTAAVLDEGRSAGSWAGFVVGQVGGGVVLGLVLGGVAIMMLRWSRSNGWSDGRYEQLATFAVPIAALFAASSLSVNSFIAAFVAGLAFGSLGGRASDMDDGPASSDAGEESLAERFGEFTEDAAQLLGVAAFFVFGNVLLPDALEMATIPIVVCALLALTMGRMLPVWVSLIGSGVRAKGRLFIGWFGPRGLASIVFALLLLEDVESAGQTGELAEELLAVVALTVAASVLLHGASAAPGARVYGAWASAQHDDASSAVEDDMAGHDMPRSRWSIRR